MNTYCYYLLVNEVKHSIPYKTYMQVQPLLVQKLFITALQIRTYSLYFDIGVNKIRIFIFVYILTKLYCINSD